jgi:hypothetical protein
MPEEAVSSSLSKVELIYLSFREFFAEETKREPVLTDLLLEDCSDMGVRGVCD